MLSLSSWWGQFSKNLINLIIKTDNYVMFIQKYCTRLAGDLEIGRGKQVLVSPGFFVEFK